MSLAGPFEGPAFSSKGRPMEERLICPDRRCPVGDDRKTARFQLGREPEGMLGVAARCAYGAPTVLVCSPVVLRGGGNAEPFPTVYWLSCPFLRDMIGRLEGGPAFRRIRGLIRKDGAFREGARDSAANYRADRARLYEGIPDELKGMINENATKDLLSAGPGGIRSFENIKCLHIYLANWLAGNADPVGRITAELIAGMDRRGTQGDDSQPASV